MPDVSRNAELYTVAVVGVSGVNKSGGLIGCHLKHVNDDSRLLPYFSLVIYVVS